MAGRVVLELLITKGVVVVVVLVEPCVDLLSGGGKVELVQVSKERDERSATMEGRSEWRRSTEHGLASNVRKVLENSLANTPLDILTPCANTLLREVLEQSCSLCRTGQGKSVTFGIASLLWLIIKKNAV